MDKLVDLLYYVIHLTLYYMALYAVAHIISCEYVFEGFRNKIAPDPNHFFGKGIRCPICLSVWLSVPGYFLMPYIPTAPIIIFAGVCVVILMNDFNTLANKKMFSEDECNCPE